MLSGMSTIEIIENLKIENLTENRGDTTVRMTADYWCPPEHKCFFFACKAIFIKQNIGAPIDGMWWFGTTLKNPTRCSTSGRWEDFGPWGTVFGSFGSQNVYLNALNPLAHLVIFLTCTLQMKNAELLGPLPTPLLPDLVPNKLTWELLWFFT